jgi:signal transduction histidine kinase
MPEARSGNNARTKELAELCTHLQDDVEKEKHELARRLHDDLGGLLTAAKMDLSWLQSRIEDATLRARLARLGGVLDEAMDLKRSLVEDLRPSLLDHFGLPTALRAHVESVCSKAGLECDVTFDEALESLPRSTAIALFRVVEEGLDNILRHASARKVRMALRNEGARHVIHLSDDGLGVDLSDPSLWRHGLTGMRHRIEALGGEFTIHSGLKHGTTLTISVPRNLAGDLAP